ncbi:MAG: hypothetical protein HFJ45_09840 [Clostridia bacterium]|nr:hypothetical protein [Clostridia bacterium]
MMKNNIEKLKIATNSYRLKNDNQITKKILEYIEERIKANQKEIEDLIKIKKEKVTYEQIENVFKDENEKDIKYKNYKQMIINEDKFIFATLLMPIGTIAVEAYDTIEVIRYFVDAIKTRNGIAISDVEYDEQSVKFLVLEIIKEALKKFDIDENLIMIMPYEECFYSYFDKVIYTYNKQGKKLRQNGYEMKKTIDKKYLYIENIELEEIALSDNEKEEKEILYGEIQDVIEEISKFPSLSASIYTKDAEKAYYFINLANSENIFVNTSLENTREVENSQCELYTYRNIILPIPKEEKISEEKTENVEEMSLQIVNKSIFEKIKNYLKNFFK